MLIVNFSLYSHIVQPKKDIFALFIISFLTTIKMQCHVVTTADVITTLAK